MQDRGGVGPVTHQEDSVVNIRGGTQPGPGVTHSTKVELHRESVDPHSDGPILHKPLGNLCLVSWHLHPARHPDRHLVFVEFASLIMTIIRVVILLLQSTDVKECLVGIFHET